MSHAVLVRTIADDLFGHRRFLVRLRAGPEGSSGSAGLLLGSARPRH